MANAFGDIGTSTQQLGRMRRRKRYNRFEILVSRAKSERCITNRAHTENNYCCRAVAFQSRCSHVDVGKTFKIGLIVNPRGRPTHFRSPD